MKLILICAFWILLGVLLYQWKGLTPVMIEVLFLLGSNIVLWDDKTKVKVKRQRTFTKTKEA